MMQNPKHILLHYTKNYSVIIYFREIEYAHKCKAHDIIIIIAFHEKSFFLCQERN